MKKFIKYLIWIIAIFFIIIITNFIISSVKTKEFRYYIIKNQDTKFLYLFEDSIQNDFTFKYAYGNSNEQIFIYDYIKKYHLIIWNISGFKNVVPLDMEIVSNDDFARINFNPQTYTEWGKPQIKLLSKVEHLKANKITIHVDEDYKLINYKKDTSFLFLNLESKGFAISDSLIDYKLKIAFEEKSNYNVAFTNQNSSFQVIILKGIHENIIDENMLFGILQITSEETL